MDYFCCVKHHRGVELPTPPLTPKPTLIWPPRPKPTTSPGARKDYAAYSKWQVKYLETALNRIVTDYRRRGNTRRWVNSTEADIKYQQDIADTISKIDSPDAMLSAVNISEAESLVVIDKYSIGLGGFMPGEMTGFVFTEREYFKLQDQLPNEKHQIRSYGLWKHMKMLRRKELDKTRKYKGELDKRLDQNTTTTPPTPPNPIPKNKKPLRRHQWLDQETNTLKARGSKLQASMKRACGASHARRPEAYTLAPRQVERNPRGVRIPVPMVKPTESLLLVPIKEEKHHVVFPPVPALVLTDAEGKDFWLVEAEEGRFPRPGVGRRVVRGRLGRSKSFSERVSEGREREYKGNMMSVQDPYFSD